MASRDNYTVGWVCALPVEMKAAEALLDNIHLNRPTDLREEEDEISIYTLGSIHGHNVVIARPSSGIFGETSAAAIARQICTNFKNIRFVLMVGIGQGSSNIKHNIALGDIIVSKPTITRPGFIQCDMDGEQMEEDPASRAAVDVPSNLLLTAAGKAETSDILGESHVAQYISDIVKKDPSTFNRPSDIILSNTDREDTGYSGCNQFDKSIHHQSFQEAVKEPKVHYGLVMSCSHQLMCRGTTPDKLSREQDVLCFETEAAGLIDVHQYLIIRGICGYVDSKRGSSSKLWLGYATASAAAYAKEILLQITAAPTLISLEADMHVAAATVLDALLLTRPEVDRSSLIVLKGQRAGGTCEWLIQHGGYQGWLLSKSAEQPQPLLWISGGPGKGKTMLAIYITEKLQPIMESRQGVLLYYFCSNRDRNRNTAVTIMRGIVHQWLSFHPHLVPHIKKYFDGSETTKYTISSFASLWRLFLILLSQIPPDGSQTVCVLDGLDECEKDSLKQLLDALRGYYLSTPEPKLKVIVLSRPQPVLLEEMLGQYSRIKLDDADMEIGQDVEKFVDAEIAQLAAKSTLSNDQLMIIRQKLMTGAEGTFLWVGFVADELKGKSWHKMEEILVRLPKGLGGIYQRLLQQIKNKQELVPALQWIVLAARPLTVEELTGLSETKATNTQTAIEVMKNLLESCGLLVKIDDDVVNLVHESAKEFFQSKQVNIPGISMFQMDHTTHRTLRQRCLTIIEESFSSIAEDDDASKTTTMLLDYANLYWLEHFHHEFDIVDRPDEFSRPFFAVESPVRELWWDFYWDQDQYGGAPPSFTLLHLAAYFGHYAWTQALLRAHSLDQRALNSLISRKDNYGRTPLFWAATRGHKDIVVLLLNHGARINSKDRSNLTALHIAITGGHKDVVYILLNRSASIEDKGSYGDTPLIRAIQANSVEIIQLLLEHGARVDELPIPPGFGSLKGPNDTVQDRAQQLLGLQEQLFVARYENSSRLVGITIKTLTASFYIPSLFKLLRLYLKYSSIGRWEVMHVLQDLVKNNKTARLRKWAEAYIEFGTSLVATKNVKNLTLVTGLSVQIFRVVSTADLKALLVIGVLVGSAVILAAAQLEWREGVVIAARTFAQFASLAYHRDAGESLHYGVREFLVDFDSCIWSGRRAENVARTVVLFSTHFAILDTQDPKPIEYFSTVIAEYYERFIGGGYEEQLFIDANRACANELEAISKSRSLLQLQRFLMSIFQFADRSKGKGKDRFLNMAPAACLILCQGNRPSSHRWLIAEALPETMSKFISQEALAPNRQRAYKSLVECLVVGKQYNLVLQEEQLKRVKQYLGGQIDGAEAMLDQIVLV